MSSLAISVLLPVYNARKYLRAAVESVLLQSFRDFELIAIDDGSTDHSREILDEFARSDARVRVIARENRGLIATLNEGIEEARGPILARMDADDVSRPERFERQIRWFEANEDGVGVSCRALMIDPDGRPIMTLSFPEEHDQIDAKLLTGRGALSHPGSMFRREHAVAVGGYDWRYEAAEDVDFFLKLSERGRLGNLPEILLDYRTHPASESRVKEEMQRRNAGKAVAEALRRRGLPPRPSAVKDEIRSYSIAEHHRRWARWALKAGHVRTARKHAFAALRREPFSWNSWRLAKWTLRGY